MPISGLALNQLVSETSAANSGFTLKAGQNNVYSTKIMTVNEAQTRYYLEVMTGYAGTQCPPSSVWIDGVPEDCTSIITATTSTYFSGILGNATLTNYPGDNVYVVGGPNIRIGSVVYTNTSLTQVFVGADAWYPDYSGDQYFASYNGQSFSMVDYKINSSGVVIDLRLNYY